MNKKMVFPLLIVGLVGGGLYYKHLQGEQKKALRERTAKKLMNTLKLDKVSSADKISIKLEKKQQPKCWIGDADVLVEDLDKKAASEFIVTLESLSEKGQTSIAKVNLDEFYENPSTLLDIATNKFTGNHALGLFMCSDYKQTGTCEGKKVMDVMELYDKYVREEVIVVSSDKKMPFRIALFDRTNSSKIEKTIETDHVYFFQYVYIKDGELIFPTDNVTKASYYKTLGKYEQRVLGLKKDIKKRIKYAFKTNKALNNFAMAKNGNQLTINLPYRNRYCLLGYEEMMNDREKRNKLKQNKK